MAFIYAVCWMGVYPLSLLVLQVMRVWQTEFVRAERWMVLPWLFSTLLSLGWVSVSNDYWTTADEATRRMMIGVMLEVGPALFIFLVLFLLLPELGNLVSMFGSSVRRGTLSLLNRLFKKGS